MRWTRWAGLVAAVVAVSGCAYGYHRVGVVARYGSSSRPDPSYYCYDCHGLRYFDPYYDWCVGYGFAYDWRRHPRTVSQYRKRYVKIKKENRDFGRYTYPHDYRSRPQYRTPRDFESWRRDQARETERSKGRPNTREKQRKEGKKERGPGREGNAPREPRPLLAPEGVRS